MRLIARAACASFLILASTAFMSGAAQAAGGCAAKIAAGVPCGGHGPEAGKHPQGSGGHPDKGGGAIAGEFGGVHYTRCDLKNAERILSGLAPLRCPNTRTAPKWPPV